MVMMDLRDVLRDILGSLRVQYLLLRRGCASMEASQLDFQFRSQLYEDFDYAAFAASMMELVPENGVIDYKDDFGLHYLVFAGRDIEAGAYFFFGPYLYRAYTEDDHRELLHRHGLSDSAIAGAAFPEAWNRQVSSITIPPNALPATCQRSIGTLSAASEASGVIIDTSGKITDKQEFLKLGSDGKPMYIGHDLRGNL